ncbi:MAG: nitroreductase family protein [Clostridiales bacterium]|jgi:nitroreductase|nr:nitroreductase family protein [Eubacteriales bacterium]MDH7566005.1 nitroreductase family protein [Clostridiales bacterium]
MDVLSAIQGRRSIRQYSDRPVEDEKLEKVLEAARLSPSAGNGQAWKFVVVRDEAKRIKLAEAAGGQLFVKQAPVFIAACGTDPEKVMMCGQHRYTIDLSIAMAYLILEAHEQGLGTCWLGRFDEERVKEILEIPDQVRVVAVTPLGYPAESPAPRPRKQLEEIVCYEKYK